MSHRWIREHSRVRVLHLAPAVEEVGIPTLAELEENLRVLRDEYRSAEPEFMQRRLLETRIALVEGMAATLQRKATAVRASTVLLACATALTAVGLGLH